MSSRSLSVSSSNDLGSGVPSRQENIGAFGNDDSVVSLDLEINNRLS